jgi:putative DNA primase/helicase
MIMANRSGGSAGELARALGGHRSGDGWVARCPAHRDRIPSLSIRATANGGLLLHCFAGCSWSAIQEALRARWLWPERELHAPRSPRQRATTHHRCTSVLHDDQLSLLRRIWCNATPAAGTEVESYLRSRALTAPVPPTLRYARGRHRESGRWLPCMVAAVQGADGRLTGLHRTYLRPDGHGKAAVEPVKKMLGRYRGGAVRLTPIGRRLGLCEGIETGLSIRQACPDVAVWCALSAGNLHRVILPALVEEVVLVADGDPVGLAAAHRAAQRYGASGRQVRLVALPSGMDANDLLRREATAV